MLTIGITKQVAIPHEKGEWIEIRKLSWKQLDDARKMRQEAVFSTVRAMGGEVMAALPKTCRRCGEEKHDGACPSQAERAAAAASDPMNDYDRATLLHAGIVKWSYQEVLTEAAIDQLDEVTAAWAAEEILAYNTTPSEEERKNVTRPSSSS